MDWREMGKVLREQWRQRALERVQKTAPLELMQSLPEPGAGMMWQITPCDPELDPDFVDALKESSKDDMTPLAAYLTSDKPLGHRERDRLARFLPKRRKTGRPQNTQLRAATTMALMFYKDWRAANKERGISGHGHGDDMKLCSAQWVVEDFFAYEGTEELTEMELESFAVKVRELMDKSKHLRDPHGRGFITFPTFGWPPKDRQN